MSKDNTSKNNKDPKSFNTPGRATLNDSDIGDVGMAVLTLAKEVWVLRDRLTILETVLAEKGIDVTDEIDRFQPDEALQKKLDEQANTMIETLLATIKGSD